MFTDIFVISASKSCYFQRDLDTIWLNFIPQKLTVLYTTLNFCLNVSLQRPFHTNVKQTVQDKSSLNIKTVISFMKHSCAFIEGKCVHISWYAMIIFLTLPVLVDIWGTNYTFHLEDSDYFYLEQLSV